MKISEQWLRTWVNPKIDIKMLTSQLTMAGLEVDSTKPAAKPFSGIQVGQIVEAKPHPKSKALTIYQVILGEEKKVQIISEGTHLKVKQKVPVALPGTIISGEPIKIQDINGEKSQGLLCSNGILGLTETETEIEVLPEEAPIGGDVWQLLALDDTIIDVDLTPNRGDCLSLMGIAREVAVLNQCPWQKPHVETVKETRQTALSIDIQAPEACPRYLGRVIQHVHNQTILPSWLKERLRRSDIRSINSCVDIINYVMVELGQPMHGFDLKTLSGNIQVKLAPEKTKLTLLDGQEIEVLPQTLIIADEEKILALAGIMGGVDSSITNKTTDIFLESAHFSPRHIAGWARQYGLQTDSAHRFERGVDPNLPKQAMARATQLICDLLGGEAGPITESTHQDHLPQSKIIDFHPKRVEQVLGKSDITQERMQSILQQLGMTIKKDKKMWQVTIPTYRFDVALDVDLIEEIARIHGYNQLPTTHYQPKKKTTVSYQSMTNQLSQVLIERGYHECITYSFVSPKMQTLLHATQQSLSLTNPLSPELAQMRLSLWPGLLNAYQYNQRRQQTRLRLFETGLCFMPQKDNLHQTAYIGGLAAGEVLSEQWGAPKKPVDFYDIKKDVESLLTYADKHLAIEFVTANHPALHPGQTAKIIQHEEVIGWLGALNPKIKQELDISGPIFLFQCQIKPLSQKAELHYQAISKYPAVRRDISFFIDPSISAKAIQDTIHAIGNPCLQKTQIFDIYQEKGNNKQKSMALSLLLQDSSKTLTDDEMQAMVEKVVSALQEAFKITLRDK